MQDFEALQKENIHLRHMLAIASNWMKREIAIHISDSKMRNLTKRHASSAIAFDESEEEIKINDRIHNYFGEILLMNAPRDTVKHIVDGELSYFLMQKIPRLDGLMVIAPYQKALDGLIEYAITRHWRKYALKNRPAHWDGTDPIEKALVLIADKKYLLSTGRLFSLLQSIKHHEPLSGWSGIFSDFLNKNPPLRDRLLGDDFYQSFDQLVNSGILSDKRHSGSITLDECALARKAFVGDFEEKASILFGLLSIY